MSDLLKYFENNTGRLIFKWMHYFGIYERHFGAYRGRPMRMLEFGVFHGGSLQMWKHYFGPQAQIVGVDINPQCAGMAEPGIQIEIGDQENREFLAALRDKHGPFDIILDDGGHSMRQQIVTFEEMYQSVKPGGLYVVEDTHTSYFEGWNGGFQRPGTFIEYSKSFIDHVHAWHAVNPAHTPGLLGKTAFGLHYYDSVLAIEKHNLQAPVQKLTGEPSWPIGAMEYTLLAEHEASIGRFDRAIAKCNAALQADPRYQRARELLEKIQAHRSAQT
jgi:SAM-dependent methyltransferase